MGIIAYLFPFFGAELPFPPIPDETLGELIPVCGAISSASNHGSRTSEGNNPALMIYAEARGPYITSSLENLAIASMNTVKRRATDGPYKQGRTASGFIPTR